MTLDAVDEQILDLLERDARMPNATVGREVGLTGPAVFARIRRMEEAGLLRGYRAMIDPLRRGKAITAVVRVVTRPSPDERSFEEFVMKEDRVVDCFDVDGEDSFILKVRCEDAADLRDLLHAIRALPVVIRTISNIVLKPIKESL